MLFGGSSTLRTPWCNPYTCFCSLACRSMFDDIAGACNNSPVSFPHIQGVTHPKRKTPAIFRSGLTRDSTETRPMHGPAIAAIAVQLFRYDSIFVSLRRWRFCWVNDVILGSSRQLPTKCRRAVVAGANSFAPGPAPGYFSIVVRCSISPGIDSAKRYHIH